MDHKGDGTTVQRQRFDVSDPAPSAFVLRVVEGPDRGASFVIGGGGGPVHAGKSEACEIRLTDPEASRRHASFEVGTNRVRVIDLGSTNGTVLENVNIVDVRAKARRMRSSKTGLALIIVLALAVASFLPRRRLTKVQE